MARLAHISDTHIKNLKYHYEYRKVFEKLFESLKEEKIDYIVHCGDIAHSKTQISPEYVQLCSEFLTGLSAIAPTYIILGNHDGNLKNSSRQDAVTPIVKALDLSNLHLLKNSGEVCLDKEITLNVLSVFDRDGWISPVDPNRINVAVYHGAISNCETDLGWIMEHGEDELSIFNGHDYAFLGDIHKTNQVLDHKGKIRYCGSTIQQNFGETDDKGYLVWDIKDKDSFVVKHIAIPNPKPFITLELTPKGRVPSKAEVPVGARLRLVSNNNLPLHTMKKAVEAANHRFKPERITFLNRAAGQRGNVEDITNGIASDNLRNIAVQEELIEEYLKDFQPTDKLLERICALNKKYDSMASVSEEIQRNINWKLRTIKWDNLFNYGEDNRINFEKLNGIVGIFGKNYSGKSSIIDSILYTIFNSTSKNERKNLNVINQDKSEANGEVTIAIGTKEYTVKRVSEKYVKKLKGEETLEAKTDVDFSVKDTVTGEIESLNGITRNETDRIIRSYFGSCEDFLSTSMSSQIGSLQFISEGSTKRKEILAKFLDLEVFDKKFKLAKEDASDLRGVLKSLEGRDYEGEILETEEQLNLSDKETKKYVEKCDLLEEEHKALNKKLLELQETIENIPTRVININQVLENIDGKETRLAEDREDIVSSGEILVKNRQILEKIDNFLDTFGIAEYKDKKQEIEQKLSDIENIERELEKTLESIAANKKKAQLLDEVPCGEKFLDCKFIKDASCANNAVFDLKEKVRDLNSEKDTNSKQIAELDVVQTDSYIEQYDALIKKRNLREKEKLEAELQKERLENNILVLEKELKELKKKRDEYNENKDAIENKESLIKLLNKLDSKTKEKLATKEECHQNVLNLYKEHGSLEQKINTLKEQKEELHSSREQYAAYDLFMRCMHSNGIAYDIIKKKLPVINGEIAKILANIVDFEVFFEADNRSLKIYIRHPNHDPRPIEMGSGAEKTLSAMAIRLSLLSVSSLPKSDIFILDEPGTSLDADNMDGFTSILELVKSYFKTVILVSHLDSLKDCVDKQITIDKQNGYAFVQEI